MKKRWKIAAIALLSIAFCLAAAAFDIQPKVILAKGDNIHIEFGNSYDDSDVNAGFEEQISGNFYGYTVHKEGKVNSSELGEYTLTYSLGIGPWKSTAKRTVIVEDTTAPEIQLLTKEGAFTIPGEAYEEEGFTATDIYDGDITDQVTSYEEDGKVYYSVKDSSGNEATAVREIYYHDPIAPEIQLNQGDVKMVAGQTYYDPGYTASDNIDGDITDKVTVSGDVDSGNVGTYTLIYTVKDSYDNEATATRTVTVNPDGQIIYLTFDDGPYKHTERLLDILDKYNVKATFFVTNQYPAYQWLIGEEARRGHTVAIHTYSHDYSDIYSSTEAYYNDLNKINDIIKSQTGSGTTLVRFPGGSSNSVSAKYCSGIMTELTSSLTAKGYQYFDWNVLSGDAGETKDTDEIIENIKSGCESKEVSIVLQHDIWEYSVDAVEEVIKWGLSNGYEFKTLTPSSPGAHQTVNN